MGRIRGQRQVDCFIFNNCKIANELRKYRDLAGCVNQVSVSGRRVRRPSDAEDWAEYVITRDLTYLDMVTANAVYTLLSCGAGGEGFQAEAVARVMAGDPAWRITGDRSKALEERLCKLAETEIYILADHDHQVERNLYEGAFLPLKWTEEKGKLRFQVRPGGELPLYQYAEDHRQLIRVPASCLREEKEGQTRHSNSDQTLALRHYLLQELAILGYSKGKVEERELRLLKRKQDRGGREGLLWTLGLEEKGRSGDAEAKRVRAFQELMLELLENWRAAGQLGSVDYEKLEAGEGYGVRLYKIDTERERGAEEEEKRKNPSALA